MSDGHTDVNMIPEYPIPKTIFAGNRSFGGVVDFLMTKLPGRYTRKMLNRRLIQLINTLFRLFTWRSNDRTRKSRHDQGACYV